MCWYQACTCRRRPRWPHPALARDGGALNLFVMPSHRPTQPPPPTPEALDAFLSDLAALYTRHGLRLGSREEVVASALGEPEFVRDRRLFPADMDPLDAELECYDARFYVTADPALVEVDRIRRDTNVSPFHYLAY